MPTNTLSHQQMSRILHEQFREVEALGFTAEGVSKVFEKTGKNESNFTKAAAAICSNQKLISCILESCRYIKIKNLQRLLSRTGSGCESVIQKLYDCRVDLNELMVKGGFSATNISSMSHVSKASPGAGIPVLSHRKEDLLGLMAIGFSASNISSMLNNSGASLNDSIQTLIDNRSSLLTLMKNGFSASNISSMLRGGRAKLNDSIHALVNNQENLLDLMANGFSASNISSMLVGSAAKLGDAIHALLESKETLLDMVGKDQGFSASNISSMLHGSGSKVGQAIQELSHKLPVLIELIQSGKFKPTELATELSRSGEKISSAIQNNSKITKAIQETFFDQQICFAGLSDSLIAHGDLFNQAA